MFNITEQRLMDQQSQIRKKQWLRKLELEQMQRRREDKPHGHVPNDSESEDEQWFLGFDEKGGDVGNRHENVEFGFRIKEELRED